MAVDLVNHPPHYLSHPSKRETIEVTRSMSFNLGNAWKYLARADHKGNREQDIEKAIWYILDEVKERRQDRGVLLPNVSTASALLDWIDAEQEPMRGVYITLWNANVSEDIDGLMRVVRVLREMQKESAQQELPLPELAGKTATD